MLNWSKESPTEDGVYLFRVVDPNGLFHTGTGVVILLGDKAYPQGTVPVQEYDRAVWLSIAAGNEYYAQVGNADDALHMPNTP